MDGKSIQQILRPQHIVAAIGLFSGGEVPKDVPGIESFQGDPIVHSSHFQGPKGTVEGKKVLVVGTGSSGTDIALDYSLQGADVTVT